MQLKLSIRISEDSLSQLLYNQKALTQGVELFFNISLASVNVKGHLEARNLKFRKVYLSSIQQFLNYFYKCFVCKSNSWNSRTDETAKNKEAQLFFSRVFNHRKIIPSSASIQLCFVLECPSNNLRWDISIIFKIRH